MIKELTCIRISKSNKFHKFFMLNIVYIIGLCMYFGVTIVTVKSIDI